MANEVKAIPEFTQDSVQETGIEGVKETEIEEVSEEEKETPSDLPAEEKPDEQEQPVVQDAAAELEKVKQGLQQEILGLRKDLVDLRGQRREIKQDQIQKVEQQLDELKDIHPEDAALIDKYLKSKGYVTKEQQQSMYYSAVRDEELNKFLEEFPEYKPENDPLNSNWDGLMREFNEYKSPENPRRIGELLKKAHKYSSTTRAPSSDRELPAKKRQLEVASVGAGGKVQRSSSVKPLEPRMRYMMEQGGWSEEEIKRYEQKLSEAK